MVINKVKLSQAIGLVELLVQSGFLSEEEGKGYITQLHKLENNKDFFSIKKESAYMHLK